MNLVPEVRRRQLAERDRCRPDSAKRRLSDGSACRSHQDQRFRLDVSNSSNLAGGSPRQSPRRCKTNCRAGTPAAPAPAADVATPSCSRTIAGTAGVTGPSASAPASRDQEPNQDPPREPAKPADAVVAEELPVVRRREPPGLGAALVTREQPQVAELRAALAVDQQAEAARGVDPPLPWPPLARPTGGAAPGTSSGGSSRPLMKTPLRRPSPPPGGIGAQGCGSGRRAAASPRWARARSPPRHRSRRRTSSGLAQPRRRLLQGLAKVVTERLAVDHHRRRRVGCSADPGGGDPGRHAQRAGRRRSFSRCGSRCAAVGPEWFGAILRADSRSSVG